MNELYVKMLRDLKDNRWSVLKIEKHLGFANGILGKVAAGKANLSAEKDKQFHAFYSQFGANKILLKDAAKATKPQDERYQEELKATIEKLSKENAELRRLTNNDLFTYGTAITKEDAKGDMSRIDTVSPEGQKVLDLAEKKRIEERIADLEKELKTPPKNPIIGLKAWTQVRYNEITDLKNNFYENDRRNKGRSNKNL